jgi:hypothetical protein
MANMDGGEGIPMSPTIPKTFMGKKDKAYKPIPDLNSDSLD